ncbi:MAG: M15 family metallopeptidase [Actinomycetota bacterium]
MKPRLPAASVAIALLLAACGPRAVPRVEPQTPAPALPASAAAPQPSATPLPPFQHASPIVQMTFPDGVPAGALDQIRTVAGVSAAARLTLSDVTAEIGGTPSDLTVAAVDPLEFRSLAPTATAKAEFVWRSLLAGEIILAHEERSRLGAELGAPLYAQGPTGTALLRIGGVAANGTPNLAGAMISSATAARLGVADGTQVLVGAAPGQPADGVEKHLSAIPGAQAQLIGGIAGRVFLTGPQAAQLYGKFRYTNHRDGSITPDPRWVSQNIETTKVPILGEVRCHRLMIPQLEGALRDLERAGLASLIDVPDYAYQGGCYVPRHIDRDVKRILSLHSWGMAIDINVKTNPAGERPHQDPRLVATFERWGFRWGGRWSPPDGHHFELAALIKP